MRTLDIVHTAKNVYAFVLVTTLALSGVQGVFAQVPAAPSEAQAVPRYGAAQAIVVTWKDNSNNETEFKILRAPAVGPPAIIDTVPSNTTSYTDNTAAAATTYRYSVIASNANGDSPSSNEFSTSISVVWPMKDGTHNMLHGFGDGTPGNIYKFHEGIDLLGSGKEIVAARGGTIVENLAIFGGYVAVKVDVGGGSFVYDAYLHLESRTAKVPGDALAPGEKIGNVSTTHHPTAARRHNHTCKLSSYVLANHGPELDGRNILNPFFTFSANADKDPQGNDPGLEDNNGDGKTVLFKKQDGTLIDAPTKPIFRDVDIIAEAFDDMTTTLPYNQGVHGIGYWIENVSGGGADVKSSASPYLLALFDDAWFGGDPPVADKGDKVYDTAFPVSGVPWAATYLRHYIVTNTTGTNGSITNVDEDQFWRTAAKDGTGSQDNGSDADVAKVNEEAKFKDGEYKVHVVMQDIIHSVDDGNTQIMVDNFRPYVKGVNVTGSGNVNMHKTNATALYAATWNWSGTQLALSPSDPDNGIGEAADVTEDITIMIVTSEPMASLGIAAIKEATTNDDLLSYTPVLTPNAEKTEWTFTIPESDIPDDGSKNGKYILSIEGTDLAGNTLEGYTEAKTTYTAAEIPQRQDDGSWMPAPTDQPDKVHRFRIGPGAAIAYVLDRSGSMFGTPLANAKSAANQGITTMREGDEVAVVSFSSSAGVNFPLTLINDDAVRQGARGAVSGLSAGGATSIGSGLLAACGQLTNAKSDMRDYVLLSDGQQNTPPTPAQALSSPCFQNLNLPAKALHKVEDVALAGRATQTPVATTATNQVVQRVHTIAFGTFADQQLLAEIANQTGGIFLFIPTRNDPLALADLFLTIQGEISGEQRLGSEEGSISAPAVQSFPFLVGADITEETITLIWDDANDDLDLELENPDGTLITASNWQSFPGVTRVEGPAIEYFTLSAPDNGTWTAHVKAVSGAADFALVFSAQSTIQMDIFFDRAEYPPSAPILISAEITEEGTPVTGVAVTADVMTPTSANALALSKALAAGKGGEEETADENGQLVRRSADGTSFVDQEGNVLFTSADLTLFDDGAHGDGAANDGIYANSFTDTGVEGTYSFRVSASGTSSTGQTFTREASKATVVTASANGPPVADAGDDETLECESPDGTVVTLDGSGSSDPDGDDLTYTWTEDGNVIAGPTPDAEVEVTLGLGAHTIELTVDDGNGATDTDEVVITVEDTTPPEITVEPEPIVLWPPNHDYHTIDLAQFVTGISDACDADVSISNVVITSATSDESEDARGGGDGNTSDDIVIGSECQSVNLRAERQGGGNGRVYTIHLAAADASGNVGTASFQVHVPHSQSPGSIVVDDGPAYTVDGCSPASAVSARAGVAGSDAALKTVVEVPTEYRLEQNYPNPFNPVTTIAFDLPESHRVELAVFDVLGRRVDTLVDGVLAAGRHEVTWEAGNLPTGVYFYRITAGDFTQVKQMTLVK